MSKLVIAGIGPASSVQDGGRPGSQRYGLVPSGAMDRLALAAANTLLGNPAFAAAVEMDRSGLPLPRAMARFAWRCRVRRAMPTSPNARSPSIPR
jgi:allophanate hydrolase subunit 2